MSINTSKKIKKVSYNQVDVPSGADISNVDAVRSDVLIGKRMVDANGNIHTGSIPKMAGGTKTSNTTLSTANKYLTSDVVISVNGAGQIYRHLNPTIIEVTTTSANEQISIKVERGDTNAVRTSFYLGWGDGSNKESIATSNASTTLTHTYSTAGTYEIVLAPQTFTYNRWLLTSARESGTILYFSSYTFGQSDASHFTKEIKIFMGDSVGFRDAAFGFCDNIKVLDFSNMNSLLEQTTPSANYYTQKDLPSTVFGVCNIGTLILGSGIKSIGSGCFVNSTVQNMIIKDARSSGGSTAVITATDQYSLPTITGKISINSVKISDYRSASYWSAKSSQMVEY